MTRRLLPRHWRDWWINIQIGPYNIGARLNHTYAHHSSDGTLIGLGISIGRSEPHDIQPFPASKLAPFIAAIDDPEGDRR